VVYLISRIQAREQFIGLADSDEITPARGFHRCNGFGIRIERLERQGFSAATRTSSRRKASDTVSPIFFSAAAASFLVRSSIRARTTTFSVMAATPSELHCSPNSSRRCATRSDRGEFHLVDDLQHAPVPHGTTGPAYSTAAAAVRPPDVSGTTSPATSPECEAP